MVLPSSSLTFIILAPSADQLLSVPQPPAHCDHRAQRRRLLHPAVRHRVAAGAADPGAEDTRDTVIQVNNKYEIIIMTADS